MAYINSISFQCNTFSFVSSIWELLSGGQKSPTGCRSPSSDCLSVSLKLHALNKRASPKRLWETVYCLVKPIVITFVSFPLLWLEVAAVVYENGKVHHLPVATHPYDKLVQKYWSFLCVNSCFQCHQVGGVLEIMDFSFCCECRIFLLKVFADRLKTKWDSKTANYCAMII